MCVCAFVDNDVVIVIIVYILCGSVVVCYCEVEFSSCLSVYVCEDVFALREQHRGHSTLGLNLYSGKHQGT